VKKFFRISGLVLSFAFLGQWGLAFVNVGLVRMMGRSPENGTSGVPWISEEFALSILGSFGLGLVMIIQAALFFVLVVGLIQKSRLAQIVVLAGAGWSVLTDILLFRSQALLAQFYPVIVIRVVLVSIVALFAIFELRTPRPS
jgi:hypothetical protein